MEARSMPLYGQDLEVTFQGHLVMQLLILGSKLCGLEMGVNGGITECFALRLIYTAHCPHEMCGYRLLPQK